MKTLRDLDLDFSYSTNRGGSLLNTFYNPALETAVKYDRATGFFTPKVLAVAARGFKNCVKNRCKIRIITSVELDPDTYDALENANSPTFLEQTIENFNPDALSSDLDYNYLQLFMYLYATGQLELKVAATTHERAVFHPKIGIITDINNDSISFSGSNNETANGWLFNIENFKVFKSWEAYPYFAADLAVWDDYWSDNYPGMRVVPLEEAHRRALTKKVIDNEDKDIEKTTEFLIQKIDALEKSIENHLSGSPSENQLFPPESIEQPKTHEIRAYQQDAVNHWKNSNYNSIFAMATGTGKTYTSILALQNFRATNNYLRGVVTVPLLSLVSQWAAELRAAFPDNLTIVEATTAINPRWRDTINNIILSSKLSRQKDYLIITTYDTFTSENFQTTLSQLKNDNLIHIADEMHNLSTPKTIAAASHPSLKYRLGLSATPTRLWRPDESAIVNRLFGADPYTFPLSRAIKEGFLVKFYYHPIPVHLTPEEYTEYYDLSVRIAQLSASENPEKPQNTLNQLLLDDARRKRSKIKKNASAKFSALRETIRDLKTKNQFNLSLIYADNHDSMTLVQQLLAEDNHPTRNFTAESSLKEREETIKILRDKTISAIVAIKCLDEGVDIPPARRAFLMSSNTDSREYVQRLGRVLRKDPKSDKTHADVYDFLVAPPAETFYTSDSERNVARNLIKNELIRAKFFTDLAENSDESSGICQDVAADFGFNFDENELQYDIKENIINANVA